MKTNTLSLSFRQVKATDRSPAHLIAELRVDGEVVGGEYVLDLRCLANALTRDGEHYIFTCGCGDCGCAGIFEGVRSRISGDQVAIAGSLPKGGAFSVVLSAFQARKAVAEALIASSHLVRAMKSEEGFEYPLMGFRQDKELQLAVNVLRNR